MKIRLDKLSNDDLLSLKKAIVVEIAARIDKLEQEQKQSQSQ